MIRTLPEEEYCNDRRDEFVIPRHLSNLWLCVCVWLMAAANPIGFCSRSLGASTLNRAFDSLVG